MFSPVSQTMTGLDSVSPASALVSPAPRAPVISLRSVLSTLLLRSRLLTLLTVTGLVLPAPEAAPVLGLQ